MHQPVPDLRVASSRPHERTAATLAPEPTAVAVEPTATNEPAATLAPEPTATTPPEPPPAEPADDQYGVTE